MPPGLYARQKWLDEMDSPAWQKDFDATVRELTAGQGEDGSWGADDREWQSFLVLHALRNKGML